MIGGRWLESCRGYEEFIQRRASLEASRSVGVESSQSLHAIGRRVCEGIEGR